MLVSHSKKFIFAKTRKTAGTAIESYFERYCTPHSLEKFQEQRKALVSTAGIVGYRGPAILSERWHEHMPAEKTRDQLGPEIWEDYFKFTIIRDPFEKLVSAYYYSRQQARNMSLRWRAKFRIQKLLQLEMSPIPEAKIIWANGRTEIEHFRNWLKLGVYHDREVYFADQSPCMNYFMRFEKLLPDLEEVCEKVGVTFEPKHLLRYKTGLRNRAIPVADFFDDETTELTLREFDWEMKNFGYAPPNRA